MDVGGTKTRVALVDELDMMVDLDEEPTGGVPRADPGFRTSLAVAQRIADRAVLHDYQIVGVGVGVPEYVTPGGALSSSLVIEWDAQPSQLFASIGRTVVESDVRCGALAEATIGAGQGRSSVLYVSVGTGISCTFVLDGKLWAGHRGEAIALGELPVDRWVDAGSSATLEEFASGGAIDRRYGQDLGAREVLARAATGDSQALVIVNSAASALGAALAWAVNLLDPELIVLGGGLGCSGGHWMEQVRQRYDCIVRPGAPELHVAHLGANSGVIGAAMAARLDR